MLLYGLLAGGRTRAELRRGGLGRPPRARARRPTSGRACPTPRTGATLVAARPPLVAFNVELAPPATAADARRIAAAVREGGAEGLPGVRALGLALPHRGDVAQVSMNVEDHRAVPLARLLAAVERHAPVREAELVGLAPRAAFAGWPDHVAIRNRGHALEDRSTPLIAVAQTKRKRRTKHRGNAAGMVETRGRTGRRRAGPSAARSRPAQKRLDRMAKPPTWRGSITRAAVAAVVFVRRSSLVFQRPVSAVDRARRAVVLLFYIPLGYYTDSFDLPPRARRRSRRAAERREGRDVDVRMLTVGPVQENCFLVRRDGPTARSSSTRARRPTRLLEAIDDARRRRSTRSC